MGVWGLTHSLVQPMGGLGMGAMASGVGAPYVVAAGGGVIMLFATLIVGRNPHVRHLGVEQPRVETVTS